MRDRRSWGWLVLAVVLAVVLGLIGLALARGRISRESIQRNFWKPVYDHLARLYDAVDWLTLNTAHRLRQPALRYLPPGSQVLEVGFGTGKLHAQLATHYQMAGLDTAPGMQRVTQSRLAKLGLHSDLRQCSVYAIPWPDASFDAVLSTFAFSAFPDPGPALDEMIRVLKPGGRVIIVDAGEALDDNRIAWFLARLWELMGDYMRDERPFMQARGLQVIRQDYGPWGCVHVTVGLMPVEESKALEGGE